MVILKNVIIDYDNVFSCSIPDPLEDARFRKTERLIIKAPFFIEGIPLKRKVT